MDEKQEDLAKTLQSYVHQDSMQIDSGYGDSGFQDGACGSTELGNDVAKMSLERATSEPPVEATSEKQLNEFISNTILPAFNTDGDGDTSLHICLAHRRVQDAQHIIYFCPDSRLLNITNKRDLSAMHISVLMDLEDVVKMLICKDAQMDLVDSEGNNILHMCAETGHDKSLTAILEICKQLGKIEQVASLCKKENYKGWTPFYTAVVHKNKRMCELLVETIADLDVNTKDIKTGNSPLHEAVMAHNNVDFVYFLLHDCRVAVNFQNRQNVAPLHIAAMKDDEGMCAVLLKFDADSDIRDDHGNCPAAYTTNERILQHLS